MFRPRTSAKSIITMLFCLIFFTAYADSLPPKAYGPTYPDIWGYDLSEVPAVKWGGSAMEAYVMDDGDIWFVVNYSYNEKNSLNQKSLVTHEKYLLIKFFKGEKLILSQNEREKLLEVTENKSISFIDEKEIIFSDASKLKIHRGSMPKLCYVPEFFNYYFLKTDSNGNEKKYSILASKSQVLTQPDKALCEAPGSPFLYQKLYMLYNIIPLKDDTFLLFQEDCHLILRFNKNLTTSFKPITPVKINKKIYISRNFFVVDYSLIDSLNEKFKDSYAPRYQSIHNSLLVHFHNQYKN